MAAPPLARVPKATPLSSAADGDASRLSVLSYNVLAPLYVRPIDTRTGGVQAFAAFEWCGEGDELLDFAVRCPRMLAEINAAAADAVMLQEVQFEPTEAGDGFALPAWLRPLTVEGGGDYVARIPAQADLKEIAERNERVLNCLAPVGNALLLKQQRLEVLEVQATVAPGARSATKGATTRVGALVRGAEGSALRDVLAPTMVFSVHLDATHEDQRVATLVKCLQQARQLGTREVLIAGDMNTEILRGSCVEALIAAAADEPGAGEGAAEAAAAAAAEEEEEEEEEQLAQDAAEAAEKAAEEAAWRAATAVTLAREAELAAAAAEGDVRDAEQRAETAMDASLGLEVGAAAAATSARLLEWLQTQRHANAVLLAVDCLADRPIDELEALGIDRETAVLLRDARAMMAADRPPTASSTPAGAAAAAAAAAVVGAATAAAAPTAAPDDMPVVVAVPVEDRPAAASGHYMLMAGGAVVLLFALRALSRHRNPDESWKDAQRAMREAQDATRRATEAKNNAEQARRSAKVGGASAAIGATIGTLLGGPVGTVIGGVLGGAVGGLGITSTQ
jgi:endonuclease/exonuclease/phosphatase family metal-dependent hydrolase